MLATVIWGLILLFFGIDELLTTAGLTNLCMFLSTGLCLLAAFATAGRHQLSRATMWISLFAGIAAIAGGWIVWEYVLELTHDGYWADGPSKPLGLWEFCTITCVPAMMAAILLPEPRRQG